MRRALRVAVVHFSRDPRKGEAAAVVSEERASKRAQVPFPGPLPEGLLGTQVSGG